MVVANAAEAAPYRPARDAEVLERLPAELRSGMFRQSPRAGGKTDPNVAATLAKIYIERSRREADPRFLGYAQGLLLPWWTAADAPPELMLLRATIKQARHEFQSALEDLELVLREKPDLAQAWLTQATVLRVLGRFEEAVAACARLRDTADPTIAGVCHWSVAGSSGQLAQAYAELMKLNDGRLAATPELAAWLAAELGDMAERLGRPTAAEVHYRAGLDHSSGDFGLRAAYADLLLDLRRPREVLVLVNGLDAADAMRLRRALALHQLADPAFAALDAEIEAGFANAHLRGEELHLREESRYALRAHGDAARALHLAQVNWNTQRESADARVLLDAAHAAAQPAAAQAVLEFLKASGMQDERLMTYRERGAP
ncbi:MAG: hypothetical protein M3O62_03040 [Pseudomonadota bacterium]|nr:hypothetical protein [Pseudomonadota bacterium]